MREPELEASSASNRSTSACAAASSASAAPHVGIGGRHLRLGLADVFDACAGEQQPQLRLGLLALGLRAAERQLRVRGVEPGDRVAGLHTVAFGDAELEQPSADLGGQLHVGRFHLAGDADAVGRRLLRARPSEQRRRRRT